MPEIVSIIDECVLPHPDYYVDAKVHMLMPNQYPCIPNWHRDAVPRDEDNKFIEDAKDINQKMYLWISGTPITEFVGDIELKPKEWLEFTQTDVHRGTVSTKHQWRLFIRLTPASLVSRPNTGKDALRRHSQVYLDSSNFTW